MQFHRNFSLAELVGKPVWLFNLASLVDVDQAAKAYKQALFRGLITRDALPEGELEQAMAETTAKLKTIFWARRLDLVHAFAAKYQQSNVNFLFESAARDAEQAYAQKIKVSPAVKAVLATLHLQGKALMAFTRLSPNHAIGILESNELHRYFGCLCFGPPHPFLDSPQSRLPVLSSRARQSLVAMPAGCAENWAGLQHVAAHKRLHPGDCIAIGDSGVAHEALGLEMRAILATWFSAADSEAMEEADAVSQSPEELLSLLRSAL